MNYFKFAFRNLRKKGIRSWLTLLGIFIGILAVVSLITLGNAMQVAVTSQFGIGSTEIITVQAGGLSYGPPGSFVTSPLTIEDVEAINRISSVEFAIGRNIETGKLEYNDVLGIGSAFSVPEGYEKEVFDVIADVEAEFGRLLKSGDYRKVVLGYNFKDGDTNSYGKDIVVGKKVLVNDVEFEVVGILKKKGSFIFDWSVLMYDDELKELMDYGDDVDIVAVKVKSKDMMERTKEDIEKLLRQRRNVDVGEEDFSVTTPEATLETVNSVLGAIQAFILIIASISILVGSIGIVNTMTTSVLERKKEIGIMKAIGSRNSQIFMQFFVESGFLGLIGGVLGTLFGLLIGYLGTFGINSWLGSTIAFQVSLPLIFFTLLGSFLIGAFAGIVPAMQAAKQNPVDALRGTGG
jgi:putative ABC transport system permease protein